ncbi:MAG: serine hydrolase [Saprospiraceae bacterium]|nr:serine hydrolase [Saprospiraceae bacterium]
MKGMILCSWLLATFLVVHKSNGQSTSALAADIKSVEEGLRPPVLFQDDTTWTIEERMEYYGVPGMSMAVIEDFKIRWSKSYGVMDLETKRPVSDNTLFQAGSISKPVAAYGVLSLVDRGEVSLTQPVQHYLKSWQIPVSSFTDQQSITLKHLLSHTGGVTVHGFLGYDIYEKVPTLIQVLNGEEPANSAAITINKLPGEGFRYSGGGYCIMQQVMVDQTGQTYPELMKKLVLEPLQMTNSTYDQPLSADRLLHAATGYLPDGSMTKGKRHTYPEMAAAGLWTTARDLAKFAIDIQMSVSGRENKVLSQEMANQMLTPVFEDFIGLGIFLENRIGTHYFGHGGWDEGFSSDLTANREGGYGVVILTNSNHPDFISEVRRSVAQVYDWSNYLLPRYEKLPIDFEKVEPYLGRYWFSSDQIATIYLENEKLYIQYRRNPPEELFRISDQLFIRKEREKLVSFGINPEDSKKHLVFRDEGSKDQLEYVHPKLTNSEKIPYEWIEAGQFDQALAEYKKLKSNDRSDPDIQEFQLNRVGYQLLEAGFLQQAIDVFRVNVALYPESFNVYDSLGEAYLSNGESEKAKVNYQRSLELNPQNLNAKKVLETLYAK